MRKLFFISGIGLLFFLSVSPARSQDYGSKLEVFGSLGWAGYWGDESFRGNGLNFGGGVGYFPLSRLGIELQVDGGKHARSFTGGVHFEGSSTYVSGSVIYRFSESRSQFYVLVGGGLLRKTETSRFPGNPPEIFRSEASSFALNSGAGLKIFLSPRLSIGPEFRIVLGGGGGVKWYYRASVRMGYHL